MPITRTPERIAFLSDVLTTAIEHAGYGFPGIVQYPDVKSPADVYTVIYDRYEEQPDGTDHWQPTQTWRVDIDTIAHGIGVLKAKYSSVAFCGNRSRLTATTTPRKSTSSARSPFLKPPSSATSPTTEPTRRPRKTPASGTGLSANATSAPPQPATDSISATARARPPGRGHRPPTAPIPRRRVRHRRPRHRDHRLTGASMPSPQPSRPRR